MLVEGGGYNNIWLETQPMGGASFGARNLTLALNNQLAFMRTQRQDGRLPGMISKPKTKVADDPEGLRADANKIQRYVDIYGMF